MRRISLFMGILSFFYSTANSQGIAENEKLNALTNFPTSCFSKIEKKYADLDDHLTKKSEKYLQKLMTQERRIYKKLSKLDPANANQLFAKSQQQYAQLIKNVKNPLNIQLQKGSTGYFPILDSVKSSLIFLEQNNPLLNNTQLTKDKITSSLSRVNQLQSKLQQTEQIKTFIRNRKLQIKETLSRYSQLPKGITGKVKDYNKAVYYYQAQLKEYKEMLHEPDRMIQKGLTLLKKLPEFNQFMKLHSELAGLFSLPTNYADVLNLGGLQTRSQVQSLIQTQLASAGSNATQILQQNLQAAQAQLNQFKDKITKFGQGSADMEMPDGFKPNSQKTKSLLKRLEYGMNFQTVKNNFFPTTTDLGLSMGYKINDKSIIGIGASYKIGLGKDFRHITITHEGIGLRSYLDVKLKTSFYASGGFEYNYQQPFQSINQIKNMATWQQSGLIGLSKMISLKTKFFKKTKMQFLWDFLSYQQIPQTQPLKFRIGYNF